VRRLPTLWIALILAASSKLASGQDVRPADASAVSPTSASASSARPQVAFAFERSGLPVPKYRMTIHDDGSAVYEGEEAPASGGTASVAALRPQPFRNLVTISPATSSRVFAIARKLNHFNTTCASKAKNIADTGTKTLSYSGPDGSGACTYNYSENKDVEALTEIVQGIAETMDQGRELDHLRRYDRLGLDSAITFLAQEVSEGRALEVGTIAASLRAIAADAEVMARVRTRANKLLTLVPAGNDSR
jgi:hypothetical protein